MSMCPLMSNQSPFSFIEFCDKKIKYILITPLIVVFCANTISTHLSFSLFTGTTTTVAQLRLAISHTRSTIINLREGWTHSSPTHTKQIRLLPFNYCLLRRGQSLIRLRCTDFLNRPLNHLGHRSPSIHASSFKDT